LSRSRCGCSWTSPLVPVHHKPLREQGHDPLAVGERDHLRTCEDDLLFELAAGEDRIMATCDRDLTGIAGRWAREGRRHSGCVLLVGIDHGEFGVLLRVPLTTIGRLPRQEDWRNRLIFVSRQDR
jgi:hypothetical protein